MILKSEVNMLYSKYEKFEKNLIKLEKIFIGVPFVLIFITVCGQVFQRFFNLPIPDTSEVSLICQAVFTFICAGSLVYTGDHITIEVHKLIKNKKIVFIVEIIAYLFLLIFSVIFIWLGFDLFKFTLDTGTATTSLRIPLWIPYGSMLVGLILIVIHTIGAILKMFYYYRNNADLFGAKDENI